MSDVKAGLILAAALIAAVTVATTYQQQAAHANVGDGYSAGKAQGITDFNSGNGHNNICPDGNDAGYCFAFHAGYEVGYNAAKNAAPGN